mgnify:CR=1 FL=1
MKYTLLLCVTILSGCATIKTVDEALSKAAVLATGECASSIHETVAICNKK